MPSQRAWYFTLSIYIQFWLSSFLASSVYSSASFLFILWLFLIFVYVGNLRFRQLIFSSSFILPPHLPVPRWLSTLLLFLLVSFFVLHSYSFMAILLDSSLFNNSFTEFYSISAKEKSKEAKHLIILTRGYKMKEKKINNTKEEMKRRPRKNRGKEQKNLAR